MSHAQGTGDEDRHVLSVVGARPNFVKMAPVSRALAQAGGFRHTIVHTGQHYEARMSDLFFEDLEIPEPDFHLGVGSGPHGAQTGRILERVESILLEQRPDFVLVYGDVNSTLAGALAAAKMGIPVGHVEAGLRSFDRTMPEETNRVVVDHVAEVLFTPSRDADSNLAAEGIGRERIRFVGNVMIDTLARWRSAAEAREAWAEHGVARSEYALVTLHRPSNVDDAGRLREVVLALEAIAREIPLVYPVHPRTRERLAALHLERDRAAGLVLLEPAGYLDFLSLELGSRFVLTDSGGVQEETTWLGIPCLTLRPNTERPVTIREGTNRLVELRDLPAAARQALTRPPAARGIPELWDGRAASRIVRVLSERFETSS